MKLLRQFREWRRLLEEEHYPRFALWKMLRAILTGPVEARTFRRRARVCLRCPLYHKPLRQCSGPTFKGNRTGCGCYIPWLLRVRRPYPDGCWGRQFVGGRFGWK